MLLVTNILHCNYLQKYSIEHSFANYLVEKKYGKENIDNKWASK